MIAADRIRRDGVAVDDRALVVAHAGHNVPAAVEKPDDVGEGEAAAARVGVEAAVRNRVARAVEHLRPRGLVSRTEDVGGERGGVVADADVVGVDVFRAEDRQVREAPVFELADEVALRGVGVVHLVVVGGGERVGAWDGEAVEDARRDLRAAEAEIVAVDAAEAAAHARGKRLVEAVLDLIVRAENVLVAAVIGPEGIEAPRDEGAVEVEAVEVAVAMPREGVEGVGARDGAAR